MRKVSIVILVSVLMNSISTFATTSSLNITGDMQTESSPESPNSFGIGLAYSQDIYTGVDSTAQLFPLFNLSYQNFFLRGNTLGYNTYEDASLSFGFVIEPSFGGYSSDDSDALEGMNDTSYLVNTGIQMQYRLMPFSLTLKALHDVTGRTEGNTASARLAVVFPIDDQRFILIPSMAAIWESSDITDYYYGVSSSEATFTRPEYSPSGAVSIQYGLTLKYRVSDHIGTTLGYVLTKLPNSISDSPIVSRASSSAVLAGVSYIF